MQVNPYTKQASDTKHDLVFFANRSTPKVVKRNENVKSKNGYGKMTKRRRATDQEEETIGKGRWLRVDEEGNSPKDEGYKTTNYAQWRTIQEKQAGFGSSLLGLGKKLNPGSNLKVNPFKKDSWKANKWLVNSIAPAAGAAVTPWEYAGYNPLAPALGNSMAGGPQIGTAAVLNALGFGLMPGSIARSIRKKKFPLATVGLGASTFASTPAVNIASNFLNTGVEAGQGAQNFSDNASSLVENLGALSRVGNKMNANMNQATRTMKGGLDDMSENIAGVSDSLNESITGVSDRLNETITGVSDSINENLTTSLGTVSNDINDNLSETLDKKLEPFSTEYKNIKDTLGKATPYLATGGGALGGLLLSRILSPQPPGLITSKEQESYVSRKRLYDLLGLTLGGGAGYLASNEDARNQIGEFFSNLTNKA